jgi:hypothetical protein
MPLWLIRMLYLGSGVAFGLLLPRIEKWPNVPTGPCRRPSDDEFHRIV